MAAWCMSSSCESDMKMTCAITALTFMTKQMTVQTACGHFFAVQNAWFGCLRVLQCECTTGRLVPQSDRHVHSDQAIMLCYTLHRALHQLCSSREKTDGGQSFPGT